jgi:hypothetical protein
VIHKPAHLDGRPQAAVGAGRGHLADIPTTAVMRPLFHVEQTKIVKKVLDKGTQLCYTPLIKDQLGQRKKHHEAVKFRIAEMEKDGKFLSKWIEQPFMWLLHYQDTKVQFYDSGKINRERIKLLPRQVRRAIDPRSFWEMLRDAVRTIFHKA